MLEVPGLGAVRPPARHEAVAARPEEDQVIIGENTERHKIRCKQQAADAQWEHGRYESRRVRGGAGLRNA